MKDYKYDYRRSSFKEEKSDGKTKYYMQVENYYIEVDKAVYKVCKASYDKIRYTYKNEVARSTMYYKEIDLATFFMFQPNNLSIINKIWLKDLYNTVLDEINQLPYPDNKIGKLTFIDELKDRQIAEILHIPRTTVAYRKKTIQKRLQQKIKKICQIE
ncbi:hypothetical protein Aargi30884_17520 [Amedibacterium intestinale]|uniref:Sigma-70 family RNA polymerase sigma factor n=1 Tax=Amedibacterium intestinale TaxID=2583452 RepID=A0A6N4TJC4_9FIRM|nr:sigma-70 family RNA polymerase sigma factor [Amedibacterium intestinale]BBK22849.1 hypothetical protein Aargi30884_17520 [Amedibacterium intestinale]